MRKASIGILSVLVVALAGVVVWLGVPRWSLPALPDVTEVVVIETESSSVQIIEAVRRTEEIALVSLAIQGIDERSEHSTILGVRVPGSERALYLQYSFTAKLGIDGGEVEIEELDEGSYRISIPEFVFIGHDDIEFKLATEQNGVLSFVTPEIDVLDMTNRILDDSAQQAHLDDNAVLLREQVEAFYRGIVAAIDPEAEVEFAYATDR
ncbi:MAG: hypothetical protein GXX90_07620 [Microbacteriaceae bacterium]|nr:hypothetical protein [Microbacteriaceae bacterium]